MKADIGISAKNSEAVSLILNTLLADEHVLYMKTRNYHWNYEGDNFHEMHLFYEGQYEQLAETIDEIAERVRMLGHYATGRLKDLLEITRLLEPDYTNHQQEQLTNLLSDHETLIRTIRKDIDELSEKLKDTGSADLLTGILRQHEKMAWMIRSYLG
ncbi:Dps family protein [Flavihumibacter petaseus]|uniref:Putative DNA-binding protein n=1 Tax=Flavihumibacter petaseus NBRC 106054 TaxID=1220578 RepID=A0A0E9N2D1_9BACT|nr:DNA starvation/stationary phase protection protein [Flavihumibacter petaseus]GAO43943.1 putative DNA-binding protein [Flavihumibacter petaseus NBRC 106054]